jgi:hypothetical protein
MRKRLIVIGAMCVMLITAFLSGIAFYLLQLRKAAVAPAPAATASAASSFANLPETAIPGRYKYISGDKENFMTLYEDHSFMNKDGLINRRHRWDLTPEGLVIHWLANDTIFDRIEAPGIYTGPKEDGTRRRMEKQTVKDSTELLKPAEPR